ncbi:MAG: VRR-NUC domain-containing protein [Marinilabiliaceae bacterium]
MRALVQTPIPEARQAPFRRANGGARESVTGRILKAEGVLAGVADLLLLYPCRGYHGLCIEMKTATGRQNGSQKEWKEAVTGAGFAYAVVRSLEGFRTLIEDYLKAGDIRTYAPR